MHGVGLGMHGERGQAYLEFLLILPFVFVLVLLTAEGASLVNTWSLMESAAREGARCGAVNPSGPSSPATTCANNVLGSLSSSSTVNASCNPSCTAGNAGQVKVSRTYSFAPTTDMLGGFL